MRRLFLLLLGGCSQLAYGAGESYMSLVGQLYAGVEMPRVALVACKEQYPQLTGSLEGQYQSWRNRNATFLAEALTQFEHADSRLRAQGHSLADFDKLVLRKLQENGLDAICHGYQELLLLKERQFSSDLKQLLDTVAFADQELTKRGERK